MSKLTKLERRSFALGLVTSLAVVTRQGAARTGTDFEPIMLQADSHWGHLTVTNTGSASVRLQPTVQVEALTGGAWHPVVTEMSLVSSCDPDGAVRPTPAYVELAGKASMTPPPWRGWSCNGQCERHCRSNVYWGAGPFRFRVTLAAGNSFASNPFKMPELPTRPDDVL